MALNGLSFQLYLQEYLKFLSFFLNFLNKCYQTVWFNHFLTIVCNHKSKHVYRGLVDLKEARNPFIFFIAVTSF